ncbi:MAG: four helix bundle protein [Gemmatimonadaceae bacterium]
MEAASPIRSFRDLRVWQRGVDLLAEVYVITKKLPKDELQGLTAHLRRAALAVPARIAEGQGRHATGDYLRHLTYAHGALAEVESLLAVAVRLEMLTTEQIAPLAPVVDEINKMLWGLSKALRGGKAKKQAAA